MASKILLADDSITIQKVVNLTFADEGIDVVTVSTGDMAQRRMAEISPDLVLADIFMPGKNGYELCQFVKESPQFKNIPVILLVGAFEPFDQAEARKVRADGHLTKPFESRTLVETVRKLIQSSRAKSGPLKPPPPTRVLEPPPGLQDSTPEPAGGFIDVSQIVADEAGPGPGLALNLGDEAPPLALAQTDSGPLGADYSSVWQPTTGETAAAAGAPAAPEISFSLDDQALGGPGGESAPPITPVFAVDNAEPGAQSPPVWNAHASAETQPIWNANAGAETQPVWNANLGAETQPVWNAGQTQPVPPIAIQAGMSDFEFSSPGEPEPKSAATEPAGSNGETALFNPASTFGMGSADNVLDFTRVDSPEAPLQAEGALFDVGSEISALAESGHEPPAAVPSAPIVSSQPAGFAIHDDSHAEPIHESEWASVESTVDRAPTFHPAELAEENGEVPAPHVEPQILAITGEGPAAYFPEDDPLGELLGEEKRAAAAEPADVVHSRHTTSFAFAAVPDDEAAKPAAPVGQYAGVLPEMPGAASPGTLDSLRGVEGLIGGSVTPVSPLASAEPPAGFSDERDFAFMDPEATPGPSPSTAAQGVAVPRAPETAGPVEKIEETPVALSWPEESAFAGVEMTPLSQSEAASSAPEARSRGVSEEVPPPHAGKPVALRGDEDDYENEPLALGGDFADVRQEAAGIFGAAPDHLTATHIGFPPPEAPPGEPLVEIPAETGSEPVSVEVAPAAHELDEPVVEAMPEAAIAPAIQAVEAESRAESGSVDSAAEQSTHSAATAALGLSPEVLDEIARRVVAQMSEAVVREIAWEVVPDCVERIVEKLTREGVAKKS